VSDSTTAGRRILVVDDDKDIRDNLFDILTDLGYEVTTAEGGDAALEVLRSQPIDIALLDLRMPGMDGLSLARSIKSLASGVVAIIVSAYTGGASPEELSASGAWKVLNKPIHLPTLLGLMHKALEQPLILIVDDDRPLSMNLLDILQERGYRVSLVHEIGDAIRCIKDTVPRVVLVDLKLPDGNGVSVLRELRTVNHTARSVVITGFPKEFGGSIEEALECGVDAVCYKPFDVSSLLSLLENLVALN
jgi:DNA-binding response OmpR family regulator